MKYARINLDLTNYSQLANAKLIKSPNPAQLENLYNDYCVYKKFKSVMPIFPEEYLDTKNDVIGYYSGDNLVAFSLIRRYNLENVEAVQFAWDYKNPELALGISSLKHECSYYKSLGYKHYYLGGADEYKSQIDGFEVLGART